MSPLHDGYQPVDTLSAPLTRSWSVDLGGAVSYPLVANGRVFITVKRSSGTVLLALDARTGATAWGPIAVGGTYGFAEAAYDDGRLFVLTYDGVLTAVDAADGRQIWITQLHGQYSFTSAPTAYDGRVYTGGAGSGGTVYANDEATGQLEWTGQVMNGDDSSPAVTASGVFVSYACEQAYDFDRKLGTLVWHHDTSCEGGGGRTAVYHSGRLYIRDDAGKQPVSLDAQTGEVTGAFSATAAPAFDGSAGFFLSNGTMLRVDLTDNRIMWTYGAGNLTSAPIVAHGLVYAGAGDGTLVALAEKTGTPVWSGSAGAPLLAPDEHNVAILPGNAVAEGRLFVAASTRLTVFLGRP